MGNHESHWEPRHLKPAQLNSSLLTGLPQVKRHTWPSGDHREERVFSALMSSQFSSSPNSAPSKSFTVLARQFPHLSNVGTQTRDLSSPLQFSHCKRQGCHGILPFYLASWNFPGLLNGRKKNHLDNHMFSQCKLGKHLCSTPTLFCPLGLPHKSLDSLVSIPFHPASLDFRRRQQSGHPLRKESIDRYVCVLSHFSHVQLSETIWTIALQGPLSMEFSRQEYWSGLSCSRGSSWPGDQTQVSCTAGRFFTNEPLEKPRYVCRDAYSWISPYWALFSWEGLSPKQLGRKSLFYLPQDGKLL